MDKNNMSALYKDKCERLWDKCPDKVMCMCNELFEHCLNTNQTYASKWLDELDKYLWDNYLTEEECAKIGNAMKGEETEGYFWTISEIRTLLKENKLPEQTEYRYNLYALVSVINMCWSDHAGFIGKWAKLHKTDKGKLFEVCYDMALDFLLDDDKVFCVRKYFSGIIK